MEIGKIIKNLRVEKQVRQEDLAGYLGVSCQAVSKWETGSSLPDITLLPLIAVYFGVSIDDLFQLPCEKEYERIENMMLQERQIPPEQFSKAAAFLNRRLSENPKDARTCTALANLYNHRAKSDHRLASGYARRAMELAPEEKAGKTAYLEANHGVCGDEWLDNHFEVIEYLKEFLQRNPGNYHGLYALIENLLADGWYQEAIPYIDRLKSIKDDYQAVFYSGDVELGMGNRAKALELWNAAVEKSPSAWQAYCCRADRIKKLGMTREAIEDYETCFAIQKPPRLYDGLCSLAQMYEEQGDYEKAASVYRRILQVLKDDYQAEGSAAYMEYELQIRRLTKKAVQ